MPNPMPSKFDSKSYKKFRPIYPKNLFQVVQKHLPLSQQSTAFNILDLACGRGQSLQPLLELYPYAHFTALDKDPDMIEEAKKNIPININVQWLVTDAHTLPTTKDPYDLITIGSAIHWFDPQKMITPLMRILKKNGLLFVYEYQFPRSQKNQTVNDWIKKQFNQNWRAPGQKPRGTLKDLLKPYLSHFEIIEQTSPPFILKMSLDDFFGDLTSQSRYLH